MSYKEFIDTILETRGHFGITDGYKERHHIIPRCLGGDDVNDNLIDLYAREHFIAHKLLAEENPNNKKLWDAYFLMSHVKDSHQQRYILTPEEYEECVVNYSKICSKEFSGENNPSYGKHWYNNGIETIYCTPDLAPDGYIPGNLFKTNTGKLAYTDGTKTIMCDEGDEPFGFTKGSNYRWTENQRNLQLEIHKGKHYSPNSEWKAGCEPWNKGKKMSEEYCKTMRDAKIGVPNIKKRIPILVIDTETNTEEIIIGIGEMADALGMNKTHARRYIDKDKKYKNRYILKEVTA